MNSEPHDSAAWRTFGMLDADAAAAFDEAMRHDPELGKAYQEMECLSAAVAVTATTPVAPQAGQLERLHLRLGLNASKRANWLGITGWAAAAALTLMLVLDRTPERRNSAARQPTLPPVTGQQQAEATSPERTMTGEENRILAGMPEGIGDRGLSAARPDGDTRVIAKVETKRLIQEIEVLREQLKSVLERDRQRFESVPGMAWPIVVRMRPPETFADAPSALAAKLDDPAITSILGDALTAFNQPPPLVDAFVETVIPLPVPTVPFNEPSAIPDLRFSAGCGHLGGQQLARPRRGRKLTTCGVTTKRGDKPVHVGRLPESNVRGGESFDFSLGSKATVPSGFILTRDRQGTPPPPSVSSTVLQGPR